MTHRTSLSVLYVLVLVAVHVNEARAAERPSVYVVNYPLKYFAERIGGSVLDVHFPAPPNVDPSYWRPDVDTIIAYQKADLILQNGAGYAGWMASVSLPPSKLVNTSEAFTGQYITIEESVTHQHGPKGQHAHGEIAFTTWLDPQLAVAHALRIKDAFTKLMPDHASHFEENFKTLQSDFLQLDADLEASVSSVRVQPMLASHPVYQYFARRHQLNVQSLHWEPDHMPAEAQWRALENRLQDHPVKWMIWEDQPIPSIMTRLQELGVGVIVFSPCSSTPPDGDWLQVMQRNVQNLKTSFTN